MMSYSQLPGPSRDRSDDQGKVHMYRRRRSSLIPIVGSALALIVGVQFMFPRNNDPYKIAQKRSLLSSTHGNIISSTPVGTINNTPQNFADHNARLLYHKAEITRSRGLTAREYHRTLAYLQNHRILDSLTSKLSYDSTAQIWLVNQPKCGTGTLERTIEHYLGCELVQDSGTREMPMRIMDCVVDDQEHLVTEGRITKQQAESSSKSGNKMFFRTHFYETAQEVKEMHDATLEEREEEKPDKCLAITAVRNPLQSIPSIFFEYRKERPGFCDGTMPQDELLQYYHDYLMGNDPEPYAYPPQWQAATTAKMLRAFGVTDLLEAMEQLRDTGYAYFSEPDPNGIWAGCELLLLQVDHDPDSNNVEEGLQTVYPGLNMQRQGRHGDVCPESKGNYKALMEYEITDELLNRWSVDNPEIHDVIAYYREPKSIEQKQQAALEANPLAHTKQIWIVNQPKCGTGSLEAVFESQMGCQVVDVHDKTKFHQCDEYAEDGSTTNLYRTHFPDVASEQKALLDAQLKADRVQIDGCLVLTAVRNPLLSIPSRFFETNLQHGYCDGTQSIEEVLGAYRQYLRYSFEPATQASTTASMLSHFGATDIREAMERLVDTGYAFFDEPDPQGPWAGCQLLLMQIDYAADNSNMNAALQHIQDGLSMGPSFPREEQCPDAAENIAAIKNYEIDDGLIDVMAKTNPEIRDVMQYYRDHFPLDKSVVPVESQ